MNDATEALKETVKKLKTERDELRLQLKLSSMEFRAQWEIAETKWSALEQKLADVSHESVEAARRVAHELAETYRTMRNTFLS